MRNPIEDMFADERFNEEFHPVLNVRYSIYLLHREHLNFMKFILESIDRSLIRQEMKDRWNQWLKLMAADHYDFMMRQPDSFLEIYDDFCRDV